MISIALDPTNPLVMYAGTSPFKTYGIFKSVDGGQTWGVKQILQRLGPSIDAAVVRPGIVALAVDHSAPRIIYACDSAKGVFKSSDAGENWILSSTGLPRFELTSLVIDPQTPSTIYVTALAPVGIYKSTDGAATWKPVSAAVPQGAKSVVIDPTNPSTIYLSNSNGVFKTTDGGVTWNAMNAGLKSLDVSAIALDPESPSNLFAAVRRDLSTSGGVFKSTNSAMSWQEANNGMDPQLTCDTIAVTPHASTIYAGCSTMERSVDGANSWTQPVPLDPVAFAIDPMTPSTVYIGFFGAGMAKTTDGGLTWTFLPAGFGPVVALAIATGTNPDAVYVASLGDGIFYSSDSGRHWNRGDYAPYVVWCLLTDPHSSQFVYMGTDAGLFRSLDGGSHWIGAQRGPPYQVRSLAIDPLNSSTLYAGTIHGGVYKSLDAGATWAPMNSGLFPLTMSVDVISSIVIDPDSNSTIYACAHSDEAAGGIYKSTDGGATWSATDSGMTARQVDRLVIVPGIPTTLYAATERSGVLKSNDGGKTWTSMPLDLPGYFLGAELGSPSILYICCPIQEVLPNETRITILSGYLPNADCVAFDPEAFSFYAGGQDGVFIASSLRTRSPIDETSQDRVPREVSPRN